MLNDEELAKKGFRAIEDFIAFRIDSVALVRDVFPMAPGDTTINTTEQFGNIRLPTN